MNKKFRLNWRGNIPCAQTRRPNTTCAFMTYALTACALFLLTGCTPFPGDEEFYEVTIPPQKLRQIETLQLQKAKNEEPNRPDANQAPAGELQLTLEQCRALAMENNLDLKVQLISPAIAAERVGEEEALFESAFFSNMSYAKTDTPVATKIDLVGSQVDASSMDFGVKVPLRTGGTVTFDLADRRIETDTEYSIFNPSYSSDLSVSISQPLLRNAGNRVNTYAIRVANYQRQITDARTKLEVIRVLAAVDRVYWRLYAARKELDVRKKQYDLAKAQLEQAQRFVSSGERSQIEVIRAEAGVAQRLEAIIVAENNLRDRERELKRVLNKSGLETQTATILVPATKPDPVRYESQKQRLVRMAIENRMEMLELELQIAEDMSTIDYMHNQAMPLVTMDYTYNINGLGPTENDSFDLLYDKRFEDHRFGLQLLVPLGNEAAKSRLRQAFYQRRQRLATRENRSAVIELEVLNAIDQLEANWQRILASRQRTILDGRLFEAEKRQFELGLGTSTDVLEAQTSFADAQSAEILALAEYQIALVDLAYATGTLLGAAKVQWEPIVPESGIN
ncbi:MAG: TolC family protein [Planctomycetota bacterium]|nr:TolC family protein [Planctomycetota bacterium]